MPAKDKAIYLTFDDGPHPTETPFVLEQLRQYQAKASFFCIGKNVVAHPEIYRQLLQEGHTVGNHTQNHRNGWESHDDDYLNDFLNATQHIDSTLFRPPYGKIKRSQIRAIQKIKPATKIIMWTVLSADFDQQVSPEKCLQIVLRHVQPGAIVVFHDSAKATERLRFVLPKILPILSGQGYRFEALPQ
ncbi:MAG: polysaccharide deacetylase family protein [Ferruginibacter sp.]